MTYYPPRSTILQNFNPIAQTVYEICITKVFYFWRWYLTPQGHPRSNLTVSNESPWLLRLSAPWGSNLVSVTVFEIFRVKILTVAFWPWLGWALCQRPPKGRWHTIRLGLPSYKIYARSRKRSRRYALPNFLSTHAGRYVVDISFTVCYPHMPIGMLWIYRLLFVFLFVRRIFCNGYLGYG